MNRYISYFLIFTFLVAFTWLEIFSRKDLWKYVSYSNNEIFDFQWEQLEKRKDWQVLALGSSEVRWGLNPEVFERKIQQLGETPPLVFNFGTDGLPVEFIRVLAPYMKYKKDSLANINAVLIGISLIDKVQRLPLDADAGFDCVDAWKYKAPYFRSGRAVDNGSDRICRKTDLAYHLDHWIGKISAAYRYRSSLRNYLLRMELKSENIEHNTSRGAHVRPLIGTVEDYNFNFNRLKATEKEQFKPIDDVAWARELEEGGVFPETLKYFKSLGITPIFFALPTHPDTIELWQRVTNYKNNSASFKKWAEKNSVVFIDLGIRYDFDRYADYCDHRHLCIQGNTKFSEDLAKAVVQRKLIPVMRGEKVR